MERSAPFQLDIEPPSAAEAEENWAEDSDTLDATPGCPGASANSATIRFLLHAFSVAGTMHIINNASQDMHQQMAHWETFCRQLKVVERFLKRKERRDQFIMSCLRGSGFQRLEPIFESFSGSVYEERWGEVVSFLKKIQQPLEVLHAAWDEQKYVGTGDNNQQHDKDNDGGEFNPADVTRLLADPAFDKYLCACLLLDGIPEEFAKWSSGCPCHDRLLKTQSPFSARKLTKQQFGVPVCPCSGMRAPEIASGI